MSMQNIQTNASDVFVHALENEGVTHIFGVPGEENLAFLESVRKSKIKFITTRHEQGAVFMAATFGRLTGKVGVALSTLGPGATNLFTGVAYAYLGGMPLLVITGQKPVKKSKQGKFQIINVVKMLGPVTKYAETIISGSRIPSMVTEAVSLAEGERPGPVHLEFPEDIAEEECNATPIHFYKVRRPVADDKSITLAVAEIEKAKSPIIVVASGGNRKLVRKQLKNFIEKTGIPYVATQMGKGVEDEFSEFYIGTTALSAGDHVHSALESADLVISVGHDISEKPPIVLDGKKHKTIHINFYPASVDEVYVPNLEVVGDISHTLWAISENIKVNPDWDFKKFFEVRDVINADIATFANDNTFPLRPERVVADVQKVLPEDGILALDNGMYKIWFARNFKAREQNSLLLDNALATMGAGLPAGIAAKMLDTEKKVLVVAGDGGFMMNVAELETAVRLQIDLVVLILNDSGYGMIRWKQGNMQLPEFGLDFNNPDFVKLAESFGAHGYRINKAEELSDTLAKALSQKGVVLIDCPIDYKLANQALDAIKNKN